TPSPTTRMVEKGGGSPTAGSVSVTIDGCDAVIASMSADTSSAGPPVTPFGEFVASWLTSRLTTTFVSVAAKSNHIAVVRPGRARRRTMKATETMMRMRYAEDRFGEMPTGGWASISGTSTSSLSTTDALTNRIVRSSTR